MSKKIEKGTHAAFLAEMEKIAVAKSKLKIKERAIRSAILETKEEDRDKLYANLVKVKAKLKAIGVGRI